MSVAVQSLLVDLGFVADNSQFSSGQDALSFDFGNLVLSAKRGTNRWFRDVWLFGGVANDGRTLALIEFEMPLDVESVEQGTAWIAEHVKITLRDTPQWLQDGLGWRYELPWRKELTRHDERPLCRVKREWFSLPCRAMRLDAEESRPEEQAKVSFDGSVLKVVLPNSVVAVPASGERWERPAAVALTGLRHLPRRLISQSAEVSVQQEHLIIAGLRLPLLDQEAVVSVSQ